MRKPPQQIRLAWATADLRGVVAFYRELLDAAVIAEFNDHSGFDGAILSLGSDAYHLEFTYDRANAQRFRRSHDDLLVLYVEDEGDWRDLEQRIAAMGLPTVASANPWWDAHGVTIEDPDGRRIVLNRGAWR